MSARDEAQVSAEWKARPPDPVKDSALARLLLGPADDGDQDEEGK